MNLSLKLFISVLYGSFGLAYFVYGKKQHKFIALLSGLGLMVYPYFVSNKYLLISIGLALIALPFLIRE
ncbi:MAG TPA: hypothetical protein ACFYDZ_07685 [Candidatus Brocadiaceae bacterium]